MQPRCCNLARLRGSRLIPLDVTGAPGRGRRGMWGGRGPFCKSRTSTAWECQRSGCSRCSGGRTRSKLTFRVDSVTTTEKNNSQPSRAEPDPYLKQRDRARTVRGVGRVVEHSVPIQRPQPDVGQEEEGDHRQPDELQQPLLFPPHGCGSGRACVYSGGGGGVAERRDPGSELSQAANNFHSERGQTPAR